MEGAFVLAFVLCVVMPIGVLVSGGVAAALLGTILHRDNVATNEGSELLDTNY